MYGDTGLKIVRSNPRYSVCHCPLPGHTDRHASSVIYHDTHTFVCFRCHVRLPLEILVRDLGLGEFEVERPEGFAPVLYDEDFHFRPLTNEALGYMEGRGLDDPTKFPVFRLGFSLRLLRKKLFVISWKAKDFLGLGIWRTPSSLV